MANLVYRMVVAANKNQSITEQGMPPQRAWIVVLVIINHQIGLKLAELRIGIGDRNVS